MKYRIAQLAGDGIGPEVVAQAVKVLNAIGSTFGHEFSFDLALVGAAAIDETGDPYPVETHEVCLKADAILFGAIGDPKYDNDPKAKVRPEQGLLKMRRELGLYANIRPVKTFKSLSDKSPLKKEIVEGADFVVIRELTGGIYFGQPRGRSEDGMTAFDTCTYSVGEIERILNLAYEYAEGRNKRLTVVDKANVLATSRLWREVAQRLAAEHTSVDTDYMFVDNAAMQLIQWPKKFDVVVTENMFGDILTDEASVITGSMGLLPSASIGIHTSVFEPIHGSYPQAAGKNEANPLATILSSAMLLKSLDLNEESEAIESAVEEVIEECYLTYDLNPNEPRTTSEVGDRVAQKIKELKPLSHEVH